MREGSEEGSCDGDWAKSALPLQSRRSPSGRAVKMEDVGYIHILAGSLGNLFLRLASTRVKVSEAEKAGRRLLSPAPLRVCPPRAQISGTGSGADEL